MLRRHREETPAAPRESSRRRAISKDLEKCIERAMMREPSKRYQTAEEMMEALRATPEGRTIADEIPGEKKAKPRCRRRGERHRDAGGDAGGPAGGEEAG